MPSAFILYQIDDVVFSSTAASFVPVMVMVTSCVVPSVVVTVKVSVVSSPAVSDCTTPLSLLSV